MTHYESTSGSALSEIRPLWWRKLPALRSPAALGNLSGENPRPRPDLTFVVVLQPTQRISHG